MFMNTFVIAIFTCIISTIFVLSVAYSMSRMRFKMRKPFMNIAMIIGLFPSFMSMIAVYYILRALNLADGAMIRVALIIVFSAGSGAGFYVAKGFLIQSQNRWMRQRLSMERQDGMYLQRLLYRSVSRSSYIRF